MCLLPLGWASFVKAGGVGRGQDWPAGSESAMVISELLGHRYRDRACLLGTSQTPPHTAPSLAVMYRNAGGAPIGVIWTLPLMT